MRVFKGFFRAGAWLVALSIYQNAMKRNEIYPTVDNLIEIESNRLKIMEARDSVILGYV